MGRTLSLYSSTAIEPEDFVRFVVDAGGRITDEETIRGQISSGDCHVWFYRVREQLAGSFEAPGEGVATKLGAPVKVCVDLQLSHHEGSGPLALEFAARFVQRWPGIATCAAYDVLTIVDVQRILQEPQLRSILSPEIKILLPRTAEVEGVISGFDGITIDANDADMVTNAREELSRIEGARYDPSQDRALGFVPSGNSLIWLLISTSAAIEKWTEISLCEKLVSIATRHLGIRPSGMIRVLMGYDASDASRESERIALAISEQVLRSGPGVVIGIFEFILDAAGLGNMMNSGRGCFIA